MCQRERETGRVGERACVRACLWGSTWQLHNSNNSTVDARVVLLCYKYDKSLTHCSLIVPRAPEYKSLLWANCHPTGMHKSTEVSWNGMHTGWDSVIRIKSLIDYWSPGDKFFNQRSSRGGSSDGFLKAAEITSSCWMYWPPEINWSRGQPNSFI